MAQLSSARRRGFRWGWWSAAAAHAGGNMVGSLAVIGPTRMDYQHTMSAVSYIARLFDKILNESE